MAALDKLTEKTREALLTATGLSRQMLDRDLERLAYHRLITRERTGPDQRGVLQLGITMTGRRAMADFEAAKNHVAPQLVPPRRFFSSRIAKWPTQSADPFVRNNGNRDVPSRGVGC